MITFKFQTLQKNYIKDDQMDEINNIVLLMNYNLDEIETHKWHLSLHVKTSNKKGIKRYGRNMDVIDKYFTTNETKQHTHPN
jgi:hypothetical protein